MIPTEPTCESDTRTAAPCRLLQTQVSVSLLQQLPGHRCADGWRSMPCPWPTLEKGTGFHVCSDHPLQSEEAIRHLILKPITIPALWIHRRLNASSWHPVSHIPSQCPVVKPFSEISSYKARLGPLKVMQNLTFSFFLLEICDFLHCVLLLYKAAFPSNGPQSFAQLPNEFKV